MRGAQWWRDGASTGPAISAVVGEIRGAAEPAEWVSIGGHLDSWDSGTGAVDDGAGVAITMAAAKLIADLPERPKRGIRVVLFANEEQGVTPLHKPGTWLPMPSPPNPISGPAASIGSLITSPIRPCR